METQKDEFTAQGHTLGPHQSEAWNLCILSIDPVLFPNARNSYNNYMFFDSTLKLAKSPPQMLVSFVPLLSGCLN